MRRPIFNGTFRRHAEISPESQPEGSIHSDSINLYYFDYIWEILSLRGSDLENLKFRGDMYITSTFESEDDALASHNRIEAEYLKNSGLTNYEYFNSVFWRFHKKRPYDR